MKSKYVMAAMILGVFMLGMPASAAADIGDLEEEIGLELPEDKIIRNEQGEIVGIDATDLPVAVQYQEIDFEQLVKSEQFREYESLGFTYDEEEERIYFAGMIVQSLEDEYEKGNALQYISEDWSLTDSNLIDVSAVRDEDYQLKYFRFYRWPDFSDWESMYDDFDEEEWAEDWTEGETAEEETMEEETAEDDTVEEETAEAETEEAAAAVSIIGGADGPTSIFIAGKIPG